MDADYLLKARAVTNAVFAVHAQYPLDTDAATIKFELIDDPEGTVDWLLRDEESSSFAEAAIRSRISQTLRGTR